MPTLPATYTAGVPERAIHGGRRASGEDFRAGFGEGLVSSGHHAQSVGNAILADQEEAEARKALVGSAEIRAKYAKLMDEAALTGADTEKLKQSMLDDLSKIGSEFQTKKGAENLNLYTANATLSFDQEANALAVKRAAAQAKVDGAKFLESEGAIVIRNPAYLKQAEQNADALVGTFARLPEAARKEVALHLVQELNQAAAWAATKASPEEAKKRLETGEWNLSPDGRRQAIQQAESEIRGQRADKEYQRHEQVRRESQAIYSTADALYDSVVKGKASWAMIRDQLAALPASDAETMALRQREMRSLETLMHSRAKEGQGEGKSDPRVKLDLFLRATAPDGTEGKLYNTEAIRAAAANRSLSISDTTFLMNVVAQQRDPNGQGIGPRANRMVNDFKGFLSRDPRNGMLDDKALSQAVSDYGQRVYQRMDDLRAANENPRQVFDPDSKHYVGTRAFMQESVDSALEEMKSSATSKLPDFRKNPNAWESLKPGDGFIGPDGRPGRATEAMLAAFKKSGGAKAGPTFPVVPSGETPEAAARREADAISKKYRDNRAAGL